MATVRLRAPLSELAGASTVDVDAATVTDALAALELLSLGERTG